jgi:hypothetical protein
MAACEFSLKTNKNIIYVVIIYIIFKISISISLLFIAMNGYASE